MALMLGYYGPVELVVSPGCSRLVQASSFLVQDIKVRMEEGSQGNDGLVLYGLAGAPPIDVPAAWSEARRVVVPANSRREWVYFLNRGSQIEVAYSVKPETELPYPLCITIAQGKESFTQWTGKPSVHNTTLLWHLVHGTGTIKQTINFSYEYYIAVRNLNDRDTAVLLDIRIRTMFHNTTGADYICSPGHVLCTYRLPLLGQNVAVLSSGLKEGLNADDEQYVKLSYEPRWIVYVVGSAILAVALLLLYEILSTLLGLCNGGSPSNADQRTSLLTSKEEEDASLGSSYDSVSHDGEDDDVEERDEAGRHLCVVCCDARKDCFFLPCGHSATCHSCGTRIVEEDGSCPFCRRKLKKVRRIFAV